jgi:hypothetical protein
VRFLVLDSDVQGRTCSYDLLRGDIAHRVRLADRDLAALTLARGFRSTWRTSPA